MSIKLYHGISRAKMFDSIAPVINVPTLTTETLDDAVKYAGKMGIVLSLRPKYFGNIDDSKFLKATLFERRITLLMGTKLQVTSIKVISDNKTLTSVVLAMQYLEKK
eukprot:61499_1